MRVSEPAESTALICSPNADERLRHRRKLRSGSGRSPVHLSFFRISQSGLSANEIAHPASMHWQAVDVTDAGQFA